MSVRIALLGAGEFGRLHAGALAELPGAELAAVCDPDAETGSAVAKSVGAPFYEDPSSVIADSSISAVVIASPEQAHVPQAEAALRSGKHALVEKPIALTSSDARHLSRVVRETGKVLLPGHILRFVPQYALVWDRLRGENKVHSVFLRRNVPRERFARHSRTHTALMSLAHDLDLLLWYLQGQRPERVYAVERLTEPEAPGQTNPDVFWGIVEFSDGTVACLESLWTVPSGGGRYVDVELEISCAGELITVRNPDDSVTIIDGDKQTQPATSIDLRSGGRRFGALREELLHFLAVIRGETTPVVSVEDAVDVISLGEALIESARSRMPLDVSAGAS